MSKQKNSNELILWNNSNQWLMTPKQVADSSYCFVMNVALHMWPPTFDVTTVHQQIVNSFPWPFAKATYQCLISCQPAIFADKNIPCLSFTVTSQPCKFPDLKICHHLPCSFNLGTWTSSSWFMIILSGSEEDPIHSCLDFFGTLINPPIDHSCRTTVLPILFQTLKCKQTVPPWFFMVQKPYFFWAWSFD